jgi:endonuclease YncB( thermonuclease family)
VTPKFSRLLIAAFVALFSSPALAETIVGQASVIDGDTLEIHGQRIRLSGIDAPESSQLCRGDDSLQYRCGAKAANELDEHIAGRTVSCEGVGRDQYGRTVAVCSIDGEDVAGWLIRNGLAFDWPRYSGGKYASAQKEAERAGRGV